VEAERDPLGERDLGDVAAVEVLASITTNSAVPAAEVVDVGDEPAVVLLGRAGAADEHRLARGTAGAVVEHRALAGVQVVLEGGPTGRRGRRGRGAVPVAVRLRAVSDPRWRGNSLAVSSITVVDAVRATGSSSHRSSRPKASPNGPRRSWSNIFVVAQVDDHLAVGVSYAFIGWNA
jgi:hypothetical protein